jgi:phytoene synthase
MDIGPRRFRTFEELEPYCHRVASSVGLICAEIFGYRDPGVLDYARDLGVALQITNILRDVAVDFVRGRLYLPLEDLEYFRCTEDDVAREVAHTNQPDQTRAVRAVLHLQAERAHVYFARALRALPPNELRAVLAAEIMRRIYMDLLRRIEAADCDVFRGVMRVPGTARARLALSTWWSIRLGGLLRH